jgi:hypothetical protein
LTTPEDLAFHCKVAMRAIRNAHWVPAEDVDNALDALGVVLRLAEQQLAKTPNSMLGKS